MSCLWHGEYALNLAIFIGSAFVYALSLWLVRSQATVNGVEIEKVPGRGPRCSFGYARDAGPVLAASLPAEGGKTAQAVVNIHGRLVRLVAT